MKTPKEIEELIKEMLLFDNHFGKKSVRFLQAYGYSLSEAIIIVNRVNNELIEAEAKSITPHEAFILITNNCWDERRFLQFLDEYNNHKG